MKLLGKNAGKIKPLNKEFKKRKIFIDAKSMQNPKNVQINPSSLKLPYELAATDPSKSNENDQATPPIPTTPIVTQQPSVPQESAMQALKQQEEASSKPSGEKKKEEQSATFLSSWIVQPLINSLPIPQSVRSKLNIVTERLMVLKYPLNFIMYLIKQAFSGSVYLKSRARAALASVWNRKPDFKSLNTFYILFKNRFSRS